MKKKICIIGILLVFTSAILAGCGGNKNQGTDNSQEISSEQENTNLLKDMEEINTFDSIIARNGKLFYTVKGILADGSDISYTIYQDKTRYVLEDTYWAHDRSIDGVLGKDMEKSKAKQGTKTQENPRIHEREPVKKP